MQTIQERLSWRRETQSGASSVEFALVVPVFLLVVFGIMYFGFIFAQDLALGNAARQGARAGVVDDGTTCAGVAAVVRSASATIGLQNTALVKVQVMRRSGGTLTPIGCDDPIASSNAVVPCTGAQVGDSVFVKASFTNTLALPYTPPSIDATGKGEFRCEFK